MNASPLILGVESSCDETAIALYQQGTSLAVNEIFSQIELHRAYGGVVPELAARDHLKRLPVLLHSALQQAGKTLHDLDGVAYTAGPGLLGALMTGAGFAQSLAYALKIPAIAVHHMEGHLLSPLLADPAPDYPFIALLVSGGHTQLMAVNAPGDYQLLGQTLDDAVGEAFDKTAKLMGLPYPGGPELARLAEQGNGERYPLPRPMTNRPGMDFSFSGLKTQVRLLIESEACDVQTRADIAAAFQAAVIDTLIIKCRRAFAHTGFKRLVVAGGVSANTRLRHALQTYAQAHGKHVYFPPLSVCTDNALMIAHVGSLRFAQAQPTLAVDVRARWPLNELPPLS